MVGVLVIALTPLETSCAYRNAFLANPGAFLSVKLNDFI